MSFPIDDVVGIISAYSVRGENGLGRMVESLLETAELCHYYDTSFTKALKGAELYQEKTFDPIAKKIANFVEAARRGDFCAIKEYLKDREITQFDLSNEKAPWNLPRYIAFSKAIEVAILNNRLDMADYLTKTLPYRDMVYTNLRIQNIPQRFRFVPNPREKQILQRNHVARSKTAVKEAILGKMAELYVMTDRRDALKQLFQADFKRRDYSRSNSPLQKILLDKLLPLAKKSESEEKKREESLVHFLAGFFDTSEPAHW